MNGIDVPVEHIELNNVRTFSNLRLKDIVAIDDIKDIEVGLHWLTGPGEKTEDSS